MDIKKFVPITKIDEENRMVYGWASTPDLDSQGEIVSVEALENALPSYMAFPAVREMHQAKAAGVTKEAITNEKGLFIGAKIIADDAWKMIKEGVYRGFSIGGRVRQKADNVITDLALSEISLVDVPANRNTVFTLVKRDGDSLIDCQSKTGIDWVDSQKKMLSKFNVNWKGVNEVNDLEKKKKVEEELVEEVSEETPQAPEEAPKAPEKEVEETAEETTETEPEVSEGSPQVGETVVDETVQASENPEDITKRLEKLEKTLTEPEMTKEDEQLAKVIARVEPQIAKVTSIVERLAERLAKVEAVAAPVKARPSYLVEKGEVPESEEAAKLEKRLEELTLIAKSDQERYQREGLQDEAFRVKDQLRKLQS